MKEMITVTDAMQIHEEVMRCPIGTTLDIELFGFAGGATGTLTLTRANELERWTYSGPFKIAPETHARELSRLRSNPKSGISALTRSIRQHLRSQVRSVVLRNPRIGPNEVMFEAELVFETRFYVFSRTRHSQQPQLHAGPYRLALEERHVQALANSDRERRKEALLEVATYNSEPPFCADEILRAGGSTETYNLDQLRQTILAQPLVFDHDADEYVFD